MLSSLFGALYDGLPLVPFGFALVWTLRYQKVADLSLAGSFALSSALLAACLQSGLSTELSIIIAIAFGLTVGIVMAATVNILKIDSLLSGVIILFIFYAISISITQGTIPISYENNPFEILLELERNLPIQRWIHPYINLLFITISLIIGGISYILLFSEWGCAFRALEDLKGGRSFLKSLGFSPIKISFVGFLIAAFCASVSGILVAFRDGQTTSSLGIDVLIEIIPAYLLGIALFELKPSINKYSAEAGVQTKNKNIIFGWLYSLVQFKSPIIASAIGIVLYFLIINIAQKIAGVPWLPRVLIGMTLLIILGSKTALNSWKRNSRQKASTKVIAGADELVINELTVSYPTISGGITVLNNVSLSACEGEVLLVRGSNGSGKTTLLKALGDWTDSHGKFSLPVLKNDIQSNSRKSIIGYVPQDATTHVAGSLTIAEHALLAAKENTVSIFRNWKKHADKYLKKMQISDVVKNGYAPVQFLSGGQTRRILLGLLNVRRTIPKVITLDEPFSHLDKSGIEHCNHVIKTLKEKGHIVLLVDHNESPVATRKYDINSSLTKEIYSGK